MYQLLTILVIIVIIIVVILVYKYNVVSEGLGGRGFGGFRGHNGLLGSGVGFLPIGYDYYFDDGSFEPCEMCPNPLVCPSCPQFYSDGGYII